MRQQRRPNEADGHDGQRDSQFHRVRRVWRDPEKSPRRIDDEVHQKKEGLDDGNE
jgi:hypothetical protein